MLIESHTSSLVQIFGSILLYSLVIFKNMKVADDTFKSNSECEWVNTFPPKSLLDKCRLDI